MMVQLAFDRAKNAQEEKKPKRKKKGNIKVTRLLQKKKPTFKQQLDRRLNSTNDPCRSFSVWLTSASVRKLGGQVLFLFYFFNYLKLPYEECLVM